jgi:ribonuclease BN (tRNA processing enzyme)
MKVKFFGVRGSYPSPKKEMMEIGGRTSSVLFTKEINGKIIPLFVDAGNGIIEAGKSIMPGIFNKTVSSEFTILFTHLHPDHTEGFTFFAPNFLPQVKIHLYGMAALKKNVGVVLAGKMAPPTYPIEYKDLKSERSHGVVNDGDIFWINDTGSVVDQTWIDADMDKRSKRLAFQVEAMQSFAPSHPQQGSIYYKITDYETKKSVACIWDLESRRGGDQRVIKFIKGSDILIHDTQYTEEQYDCANMIVQGFGHSTYDMAVENAQLAGVKRLFAFHYDPNHTDEFIFNIIEEANKTAKEFNWDVELFASHEGLEIKV